MKTTPPTQPSIFLWYACGACGTGCQPDDFPTTQPVSKLSRLDYARWALKLCPLCFGKVAVAMAVEVAMTQELIPEEACPR